MFNESKISRFSIYDVCATQNKGIQTLKDAIGKSADGIKLKQTDHYFRMAIDRSFTLKGTGLIVTGMVFSGATNLSKILTVSSNGVQVRVRGIRANNQKKDTPITSDSVKNLQVLEPGITRGICKLWASSELSLASISLIRLRKTTCISRFINR